MRGLQGDFATMPLRDAVAYLAGRSATGLLHLERLSTRKQVQLQDGRIIDASSTEPREYLGQFLINLGHITEEQFNKAYETQQETQIFLGKILVMTGSVSEQTIQIALSLKFRETLLEAYRWTDGTFSFQPGQKREILDGIDLKIELSDVQKEADFRESAWQAIRSAFPSGKVRLTLDEKNLPSAAKPGSLDDRLFSLIREGYSIDGMILALHATDFFVYQRLYALYRLEAIQVDSATAVDLPTEVSAISGVTDLGVIEGQIESALLAGDLMEAEELARRAHEASPSSESANLLKKAEVALMTELRKTLINGKPTPKLLVASEKVKSLPLSAPERYLLSKIDGKRDLASIVRVSPIREVEALKYVKQFLETGLIAMKK